MATLSRNALQERLAELERQISRLQGECDGIRFSLGLNTKPDIPISKDRAPRASVKKLLLDLLEKAGPSGLNAVVAVEMAAREGVTLNQASASSTLSRLKDDNVVSYDNDRYRLAKHSSGWGSNVHPHPASKSMP